MKLIDRFTPADYASLDDFYANYTMTIPEKFNFAVDVIDEYARLAPSQRAMIWVNEQGEEHTFTFSDIKRFSDKAANALLNMGVRPGDPVLLMLKRRYEYWFLALGLMRLHCIQIPATHQLQKKDIVYRANAADIRAIICVGEDEVLHHVSAALPESPTVTAIAALGGEHEGFLNFDKLLSEASDRFDPAGISTDPDDVMLMYFTSGTTGMPKMVAHNFKYPLGHLITGRFWHNLDDTSIHLTTADSGWAKCGWGKLYGQWIAGATLFVYDFDKFNPHKMLEVLEKYRVTSFCAPPTIYRFLIKEDLSKFDLSALKWGTVAGEPLNPEVFQQFYRATGVQLREGFGQTETTPLLLTPKWMEPVPGSCGKPSPHYTIRLLDDEGHDVEDGEEGEICVDLSNGHPAGLFMGYYRDAERTAEAFAGGVYHTGDMAWRDDSGYYWFIGRADDVIKSSGYRIGPFEVESALIEHPAVLECAITGVPDPDRGQVVKATIMLARGYEPSDALKKELQNHVKRATAPYKYPRIIEFVDELPKTISGKIQRKKLREHDKKGKEASLIRIAAAADVSSIASLAAQLWSGTVAEYEAEFAASLADKNSAVFLALEEDKVVGFSHCQLRHDYVEGTDTSPVGYLEGIYVLPECRGRGYAAALLSACEAWARSMGCTEFASDCAIDNDASIALHLKAGFEEKARIVCFAKKL